MNDTMTTVNNAMKYFEKDGVIDIAKEDHVLLNTLQEKGQSVEWLGGKIQRVAKTKRPRTFTAVAEGGTIPATGVHAFEQMFEDPYYLYASTGLTAQAMDRAIGTKSSFVKIMTEAITDLQRDFKEGLALVLLGDGSGRLAKVVSCVDNDDTITVDNTTGTDNIAWNYEKGLAVGMVIDVRAADGTSHLAAGKKAIITAINSATHTITVKDADDGTTAMDLSNVADDDYIYLAGSRNIMPKGIMAWCDDDAGANGHANAFQGLDRTAYSFLKGRQFYNSGTARDLTTDILEDVHDTVRLGDGKGNIDMWAMSWKRYRAFCRTILQNLQYVNKETVYPGLDVPQFPQGAKLMPMVGLPDELVFGLDTSLIEWAKVKDFEFVKEKGDTWFRKPGSRTDEFEAWGRMWFNFWVDRCDNFARIGDLTAV